MPYKDKKEYMKYYYQAHREEQKARCKAYYKAHREDEKARCKAYHQAHREDVKARCKAYNQAHREEHNAYQKSDTNSIGHTKSSIRLKSSRYLFNVLKHTKLKNYEIHHCFGYDDYRNFIYIPKSLHLQIHQYLRNNHIDADTDHYNKIVHLIIDCEDYVYIKA